MTAEIIQFIPKPNPNREKRELEKEAAKSVDVLDVDRLNANAVYHIGMTVGVETIPYGGQGIDGMTFEKEPA